jgi:hypothetical protein
MKRVLVITLAFALCLAFSATSRAATIALTYQGDFYLGYIDPNLPSDPADEANYINYLTGLAAGTVRVLGDYGQWYDRQGTDWGDTSGAADALVGPTFGSGTITFSGGGSQYILAKYGNNPALVWYNPDGFWGDFSVQAKFTEFNNGGGMSHVDLFNYVPDGGATLMLLGGALIGLGALRRKFGA